VALDTFQCWQECRRYATGSVQPSPLREEALAVRVNGGNPVVDREFDVDVIEHRRRTLEGSVEVRLRSNAVPLRQELGEVQERKRTRATVELPGAETVEIVEVGLDLGAHAYRRERIVFARDPGGRVSCSAGRQDSMDVIGVSNGVLSIAATPDFGPVAHSCVLDGQEWLDSTYPNPEPRDWWNPWLGGVQTRPQSMEDGAILKESTYGEHVERADTWGNRWTGIALRTAFCRHEEYRGLEYVQYYLLLPGIPLVLLQSEVRQNTGRHLELMPFDTVVNVRGGEKTTDTRLGTRNAVGQSVRICSGHEEIWHRVDSDVRVTGTRRAQGMMVVCAGEGSRRMCVANKASTAISVTDRLTCENGRKALLPAKLLLFSTMTPSAEALTDLRRVSLEVEE
jgi:hypothetical protein